MQVPLLDLTEQNRVLAAEFEAAFTRVLKSGQFILGAEVQKFETECARLLEVKHALGVSSGTDALLLALMTLGVGPGDEVICPSFTFFATAGCVARAGAKPVFVDSCPVCFNLEVADVERKISKRTKAIIPVHLFGQAAEMDTLMAVASRHKVPVIEDAAQAFGARYNGRALGGIGAFGAFSFFPSKNLGGLGDSGLLVTNDDALAERARILRVHGGHPKYFHKHIGGNFRIDALQAALLAVKLPHVQNYSAKRRANAEYYTERLRQLPGTTGSIGQKGCGNVAPVVVEQNGVRLILPAAAPQHEHIWNQYTLRVIGEGRRNALRSWLTAHDIGSEIYYPLPLHEQECFAGLGGTDGELPCASELAREVLSIPIFPELTRAQQDAVVYAIAGFLRG